MVFVIVPHISMGSLSDYKICGNSGCESPMSRVKAIRDHRGKDCRFLSFRRGDTISVYHKLTGRREDLWAGSIDKQFGYFPKDAVKEEQVYATIEKVVETQRSDFFCMDELGYPIDSSDLDSEDENGDQKIQIQESESTPTVPHTDDTNTESPSPSADPSADFPVPPQQADATTTAGDENKNAGDAAAGTQGGRKEAPDNLAAPSEQGGSPSSSWLGSSVTGWLGLGREEESVDVAEEAKDNDSKETKSETFTSSVTGWLGFGGEGIPDDTVEKVTFRSRRMSLDLEGSQLHEEEEKEVRTLDWLGSGLSRTLGFGATTQESGHGAGADREAEETVEEEKEQSSSSWFGIGNILGFGKDESEVDESTGGRSKDEDTTFERETLLENGDASQTQTEEEKIEPDTTRLEEKQEERERVEELQGEKKQEEVEELKEEENIEEVDEAEEKKQEEVEELKEEEKREAVDETEEKKQEEVEELKEEENIEEVDQAEEKKQEEVEELKEEENIEEVDEAEEKKQVEESKVEEKQEIEKFKEEEKQEKVEELQGEKKPVEVEEELIEKEKQQEVKEMQEAVPASGQLAGEAADLRTAAEAYYSVAVEKVVSSLPDDIRPGPDLYGVPWEPIIVSSVLGLVTLLLFTCRCYSSVRSRMYRGKEQWMAAQAAELLDEKCKVLETLSKCQQEYDELEDSLRDSGALAQTQKTEHLEMKARQLEHAKKELERDLEQLKDQLEWQKQHREEQERRIAVLEEGMKTFDEETKELQSQEEQAQTTLKVYSMNSDRLQRNLETSGEENTLLQESNAQLRQQVEGWAERVSELEEEMRRCEVTYSGMQQDVANKDERIMSLTDCLLRMKAWDSDLEEEEGAEKETSNGAPGNEEENGRGERTDSQGHLQKVQKLIYAAKLNADLKSVDEDKDRVFAKLNNEVKFKEDLQVSIKELENEKVSLQSDAEHYSDQVQRLQQKLQIMTEMYQENELKLHRLLTVEEKERLQKEEKLNKADKNIALAMEELNNYRQRAEEMEEELEKSKQSYQTQISAHEKKAHNNWLAARAADRDLTDIRRENALLRQKLTDTQFKLEALDKDPYALDSLARPMPFRAERSPYGPSPLGRPASETRAFLSPPTLMDGPPTRLSPRVGRGPMEPPGGQGEMERSGGPHSDSGSISPTWERDRRGPPSGPPGPLGPPGYMFPEPGGPMFRRPPPHPGAMGLLPPPGSLPPGPPPPHLRGFPPAGPPGPPHPADMADGSFRENSLGPGEQDHRESGPGDRRTPPEADPRMGGPLPPGPPGGAMDGPFPRRAPYGPPPPDFYASRGPGGPPMMPRWAPPPPGMMFPPRFPPGGPLPPAPHPHYGPPMRHRPADSLPPPSMGPPPHPQQALPSPPHSQSPDEHRPSPEDAI
ncbi:putative cTAGE family member 5 [Scophthalmus maximus]|nr:putative cTAGE family member 5 [Scophthalmus maximus]